MILADRISSLVKLSDCSKFAMLSCVNTADQFLQISERHSETTKKIQEYAKKAIEGELDHIECDAKVKALSEGEFAGDVIKAVTLQGKLNSECMLFIVNCCFTLESYINTLAHYLLSTKNMANTKSEIDNGVFPFLMKAFDKQSTVDKWSFIGKLDGKQFDRSRSPFQDLQVLFHFRNDMAHDKVNDFKIETPKKYNNKLPNFMSEFLTLEHVMFAAFTYQSLISELKNLLGVVVDEFHRDYNLSPWFNSEIEQQAKLIAEKLSSMHLEKQT